jgi:hypothetical protein
MDKNLVEKELIEYIHGLVAARTDERRIAFIKEKQHSISSAVNRIKNSCSYQMAEILDQFNWLFNGLSE